MSTPREQARIPGADTGIGIRHTLCDVCTPQMHCGLDVYVKDGKVLKVEGSPDHPVNRGYLCTKGVSNRQYLYREDRVLTPLRRTGPRGSGQFEPISWEEALEEMPDPAEILDKLIQKRCRGDLSDPGERRRTSDALLRRGFAWRDVKAAMGRYAEMEEDGWE